MTDQPTPEKIRAALDNLALWSARHGIRIEWADVSLGKPDLTYCTGGIGDPYVGADGARVSGWFIHSFDDDVDAWGCEEHGEFRLSELSAHERMEIMSGRNLLATLADMEPLAEEDAMPDVDEPDLDRMLREAFMAGMEYAGEAYGVPPFDAVNVVQFEKDADEYAAKIMEGQGK